MTYDEYFAQEPIRDEDAEMIEEYRWDPERQDYILVRRTPNPKRKKRKLKEDRAGD